MKFRFLPTLKLFYVPRLMRRKRENPSLIKGRSYWDPSNIPDVFCSKYESSNFIGKISHQGTMLAFKPWGEEDRQDFPSPVTYLPTNERRQ